MGEHHRRLLRISDICHLCGHPGADAIDHRVPLQLGGADDDSNKAPAHHFEACSVCGHKCNREKGARLVGPAVRRSGALKR